MHNAAVSLLIASPLYARTGGDIAEHAAVALARVFEANLMKRGDIIKNEKACSERKYREENPISIR